MRRYRKEEMTRNPTLSLRKTSGPCSSWPTSGDRGGLHLHSRRLRGLLVKDAVVAAPNDRGPETIGFRYSGESPEAKGKHLQGGRKCAFG